MNSNSKDKSDNQFDYVDDTASDKSEYLPDFEIKWSAGSVMSHRGGFWYVGFFVISLLLSAGVYLLFKDIMTCGVILFCALVIIIFGLKKPRKIDYLLTQNNIKINNKSYSLHDFKYFTISKREKGGMISLIPLKRFSPSIIINYDADNEQIVVGALSSIMPLEQKDSDVFDNLMHFIGF